MAQIVLNKLRGVNATTAELLLQEGESGTIQNVRNRPIDNWSKRSGVESVTEQSSPIMGIFDVELDGLVIPIYQHGDTLVFFGNLESPSFPNIDPFPPYDPLDGGGNRAVLFLIEPLMRAVQERTLRVGLTKVTWPTGNINSSTTTNLFFNPDGTLINGTAGVTLSNYTANLQNVSSYWPAGSGTAQFPINNIYKYDLAYMDQYLGQAANTRASQLVNVVRTQIISLLSNNKYVGDPEGQSSMPFLSASDIGLPSASTPATARGTLTNMRNAFRLVFRAAVLADARNSANSSSTLDQRQGEGLPGTCDSSKADASTAYDSNSFGPNSGITIGLKSLTNTSQAQLNSFRGLYRADLTNYSGSNGYFYFKATPQTNGANDASYAPNGLVDSLYHRSSDAATTGGSTTSSVYGSQKPTFSANQTCPIDGVSEGWKLDSNAQYAVFNVTFTNFF